MLIFAGCSFDANELGGYSAIDSSAAIDGPSRGVEAQNDVQDTKDSGTTADGPFDAPDGSTADRVMDFGVDSSSPHSPDGGVDSPRDAISDSISDLLIDAPLSFDGGSGGIVGTGGRAGTGGTGGISSGGTGGVATNTGGVGATSTGGAMETGGAIGTGGSTSAGGTTGTGGATMPDAGPDISTDSPSDPATANTLLSGLLAYYKCESPTGTTLQDSSGNGNHGTLVGGTSGYSFAAGKVGNGLTLAKAGSGYVSVPPAVFANATNITVATWVYVTTAQNWQNVFNVGINAKLASNTSTGTHYMNLVPKNDGTNLVFAISKDGYSNEQKVTSTALATGTWKHVAVVLGSGQGTLYVDGVAASTGAISLRPADLGAIDYAYLGKSQFSSDPYFDGQLDEFRVYGRALSAAEILELYQFAGP